MARQIGDLPNALDDGEELARRFAGKRLAVFLDYDGTLTPIRDRRRTPCCCSICSGRMS